MDNVTPAGTTASAIAEATKHIKNAAEKCKDTTIVAGGFRCVVEPRIDKYRSTLTEYR
jgi:hypothetical protein